jgi:tight adherence protein C
MVVLAILAVVLVAVAVAFAASAVLEPRVRRREYLGQIEAYGYAGSASPDVPRTIPSREKHKPLDELATWLGNLVTGRFINIHEDKLQRELISAGFFRIGARRFIGYRALAAIAIAVVLVWLFGLLGAPVLGLIALAVIGFALGWIGPSFVVHRRARQRLHKIDVALPGLIDLLVVTLEAGVGFTAAMRLAAERLRGPLGEEVRLTIQEQTLGLSTLEALQNWQQRCETPSVHSFVRAMVQGDRLGVSIGQILRNQAIEMRARRKAMIEETAQKAPIKMLFPLIFLIFPALFLVILGPAMFIIAKSLGGG